MALDAEEQELFDFAIAALPSWFTSDERQREELAGMAKMFGLVRAALTYWFAQTLITGANGAVPTLPDWLNQHAADRGTRRQAGETTPALANRLRNTPDSLTYASIRSAAQAIVIADGGSGTVGLVELPRFAAHLGTYTPMTGTGGEFSAPNINGIQRFTPATGWPTPPVDSTHTGYPFESWELTTTGAANPLNDFAGVTIDGTDGTPPLDIIDNAVQYSNPVGVASVDASVTWTARKLIHPPWIADGHARAFIGRGYRMARTRPPTIVIILPPTSSASSVTSVREMLRQKKAAGVVALVERKS